MGIPYLDGKPGRESGRDGADLVDAETLALPVGHHVYSGLRVLAAEALRRCRGGKLVGVFDQPQALDQRRSFGCFKRDASRGGGDRGERAREGQET